MLRSMLASALLASVPLAQTELASRFPITSPTVLPKQFISPGAGFHEFKGARPLGGNLPATATCYTNKNVHLTAED